MLLSFSMNFLCMFFPCHRTILQYDAQKYLVSSCTNFLMYEVGGGEKRILEPCMQRRFAYDVIIIPSAGYMAKELWFSDPQIVPLIKHF